MPLTEEQMRILRAYRAITANGRLVVAPFIKEGDVVSWVARLYVKGTAGHSKPTAEAVQAVDMPPEWAERAELLARRLNAYHPVLPKAEIIEDEAKFAGLPVPKATRVRGVIIEIGKVAKLEEEGKAQP